MLANGPRGGPTGSVRFSVRIYYREPTYEKLTGGPARTYSGTFDVFAPSIREAKEQALLEFRQWERESHVGWIRDVQSIEVMPPRHPPEPGPGS